MNQITNTNRRQFLSSITFGSACIVCGGLLGTMISSCDTIEEGEPVLSLDEYPELQKPGGAIKKRYRKLNNSEPLLIIRVSENDFVVYSAICTHQAVELLLPEDGEIRCPNHDSLFRVSNGEVIHGEAIDPLERYHTTYNSISNTLTIS